MGDYLSTPEKTKYSNEGASTQLLFGASSMQGWRKTNEDAHVTAINFEPGMSLFAVFDGHGGCEVAKYCENHIIKDLQADKDYQEKNYELALKNVFLNIDQVLLKPEARIELNSYSIKDEDGQVSGGDVAFTAGCTANVILVTQTHIYCANAGDARGVLCEKGKAVDLSKDHKPDVPTERSRVVASGHYVEDGRVDGVIAISRALGDWEFKSVTLPAEKMAVSGLPEVSKTAITANSNFIICACDGIWDCMTSQQACDFVLKSKLKLPKIDLKLAKQASSSSSKSSGKGPKPKGPGQRDGKMEATIDNSKFKGLATVVEMMFEQNCAASVHQSQGLGCDNMTCVIIEFNHTVAK